MKSKLKIKKVGDKLYVIIMPNGNPFGNYSSPQEAKEELKQFTRKYIENAQKISKLEKQMNNYLDKADKIAAKIHRIGYIPDIVEFYLENKKAK
jgi:hypothetical protein